MVEHVTCSTAATPDRPQARHPPAWSASRSGVTRESPASATVPTQSVLPPIEHEALEKYRFEDVEPVPVVLGEGFEDEGGCGGQTGYA